jgi:hypothetical protein
MLQFNGVCEVPNIINAAQCVYPPGPPPCAAPSVWPRPAASSPPRRAPSVWPHPAPSSPPPSGPLCLAPSTPPPPAPPRAPSVWPCPPPSMAPTVWPRPAPSVWPRQPCRWAPSAPSVRPCLLFSTNNYKFFQVFVSQCLSCVRSLKSVASLDVVPLHETHFTRAFSQGSQS